MAVEFAVNFVTSMALNEGHFANTTLKAFEHNKILNIRKYRNNFA